MFDFIQGDKFEKVADLTFAPQQRSSGDYSQVPNTFSIEKCFNFNPCIVYTHTFYAKELFEVIKNIDHKFVVVTHNCDNNVDFTPPKNVIKWFSQNVNIIHDKIESIPIGLENSRWFKDIRKIDKITDKLKQTKGYKHMAYMNHNTATYPKERTYVYELFKDKTWVTVEYGQNGQAFDQYLDNIYNHKYVFCPRGNGMDTHRLWESIYMNTFPIVKKDINNQFYSDMPILFVDNWCDVTFDYLIEMCPVLEEQRRTFNKERLTFEYWKNKIKNT